MKDSQGTPIKIGNKLKSSESSKCIPAIQMIEEGKFIDLIKWDAEPFLITQQSMSNTKWIVCKDGSKPDRR